MLPRVIHYCWFGRNPLPDLVVRCIESWKKYLPGYEIKEWNEDNFDVSIIPFTKEAYKYKKYAFVSDYARFWILYNYGGVYFDTDVEVIKPMDELIQSGPYMGGENIPSSTEQLRVNPGLGMAAYPKMQIYKDIMSFYEQLSFIVDGKQNLTIVVKIATRFLKARGLKNTEDIQEVDGITIYPADYFASRNVPEFTIPRTENSYSIHYYAASWKSPIYRLKFKLLKLFPRRMVRYMILRKKKLVNTDDKY